MEMPTNQDKIKKAVAGAIFVFLMIFSADKMFRLYMDYAQMNTEAPQRTMAISAQGKVDAVPDIATFYLSVVSQGKNTKTVQDDNVKKMNDVMRQRERLAYIMIKFYEQYHLWEVTTDLLKGKLYCFKDGILCIYIFSRGVIRQLLSPMISFTCATLAMMFLNSV